MAENSFKSQVWQLIQEKPLNAVDVGAAEGIFPPWRAYMDFLKIAAIEPNEEECQRLSDLKQKNVTYYPVALYDKTGTCEFYATKTPTGSSLYPLNEYFKEYYIPSSYGDTKEVIQLTTQSFSDFLVSNKLEPPKLIKLDTQGSELAIFSGIDEQQWGSIDVIFTEVSFREIYKGTPLFCELHNYLNDKGFTLVRLDTYTSFRKKNDKADYYIEKYLNRSNIKRDLQTHIMFGDALYMRIKKTADEFADFTDMLSYILICIIYQFMDEALFIVEDAQDKGIIKENIANELRQDIISSIHIPHGFPAWLFNIFDKMRFSFLGRILKKNPKS